MLSWQLQRDLRECLSAAAFVFTAGAVVALVREAVRARAEASGAVRRCIELEEECAEMRRRQMRSAPAPKPQV